METGKQPLRMPAPPPRPMSSPRILLNAAYEAHLANHRRQLVWCDSVADTYKRFADFEICTPLCLLCGSAWAIPEPVGWVAFRGAPQGPNRPLCASTAASRDRCKYYWPHRLPITWPPVLADA